MKLATVIATTMAAVSLAACGSTAVAPTARPTLAPTVAATVAPTVAPTTAPSAIRTVAPTPKPKLGVYVTTTCGAAGTEQGGSVTFHGVTSGEWMGIGSDPEWGKFPKVTYSLAGDDIWGRWAWDVWSDPKAEFVARGTFTISEC